MADYCQVQIVDAGKKRWHWRVTQPINNYNVTMNIGQYERIAEVYEGKKGPLGRVFLCVRL
jgi:hypothetical protein